MAWKPKSFEPDPSWKPSSFQPAASEDTAGRTPAQRTGAATPALAAQSMRSRIPTGQFDFLSSIAGMGGGIAGPALAGAIRGAPLGPWGMLGSGMLGAGLAAAGAEGARQVGTGEPTDPRAILARGGEQAALEIPGAMGAGLMRGSAKALMQGALRPTLNLIRKARGGGELIEDALASGATVGKIRGMGGGLKAAEKKRGAAGEATKEMLSKASGARFKLFPMMPKLDEVVSAQSPRKAEERTAASAAIRQFLKNHPQAKSPAELKEMKQNLWELSKQVFPALEAGDLVRPNSPKLPVEVRVYLTAARNINDALESIPEHMAGKAKAVAGIQPPKGMKGVKAQEDVTRRHIGVARGVKRAEDVMQSGVSRFIPAGVGRGSMAAAGGALGASRGDTGKERLQYGIEGGLAGLLLSQPEFVSRLAHVANNPALINIVRQSPRTLAFLLFGPDSTAATPR